MRKWDIIGEWSSIGGVTEEIMLEFRDNGHEEGHLGPFRDNGKKSGSVPDVPGQLATMYKAKQTLYFQVPLINHTVSTNTNLNILII